MLNITYNNVTVNPQRPEAQAKTFSSADVTHGTDSCIVKACKVANSNGLSWPMPPAFTPEEVEAFVAAKKAEIEILPLLDGEGNPISYGMHNENVTELQILEPNAEAIEAEYYEDPKAEVKVPKKASSFEPMMHEASDLYADLDAAKAGLIDKQKQERAEALISKAISECLIVPELSEEFKAQFTLTDIETL